MTPFVRALNTSFLFLLLVGFIIAPGSASGEKPADAPLAAGQIDIHGPAGSDKFGETVTVLSNGNFVVTDKGYDKVDADEVGAVYLYNGVNGALISMLIGTTAYDRIGSGGIIPLNNGHFVINSPSWDKIGASDAGAVTWVNGSTGLSSPVSSNNSLIGSKTNDKVGEGGVTSLISGNYVVRSPNWDNVGTTDAGAVTWGDGTGGVAGPVSIDNSLIGSQDFDKVGNGGVTQLSNGNYVTASYSWSNLGAATWADGTRGITGFVSTKNSLVGGSAGDWVGFGGVTALTNDNYVVRSPYWGSGVGAATWGDGTIGITGTVSMKNSLVGSGGGNYVSTSGATALSNGNYVVCTATWDGVGAEDAGAVTWRDGTVGITGTVSTSNSLVGAKANDYVGSWCATPLTNGNYVVRSPFWNNGDVQRAGAATWGDGSIGITGTVSALNSLVGSKLDDKVSEDSVVALSNDNFVVRTGSWDNASIVDAGAATWGDGTIGITGTISALNSLVGTIDTDRVAKGGVAALSNGNYVVSSPNWHNGSSSVDGGAATWGDGSTGVTGTITAANSLFGLNPGTNVSTPGVTALSDGSYVVLTFHWADGGVPNGGAATWGDGIGGLFGTISPFNSLYGSTFNDRVGEGGVVPLSNGRYVVYSPSFTNGGISRSGAVTVSKVPGGLIGPVTSQNSVLGQVAEGGASMVFQYDAVNNQLVVGRPAEDIVTLFGLAFNLFLPIVSR